jgi:hypothetical protein
LVNKFRRRISARWGQSENVDFKDGSLCVRLPVLLRILEGANLQRRDEFGKLLAGADFKVERTHPLKENSDTLLYTPKTRGWCTVAAAWLQLTL